MHSTCNAWILTGALLLLPVLGHTAITDLPERVRYDNAQGTVIFNHSDHAGRLDCRQCHQKTPPEKITVSMTFAHNTCRGCHGNVGAGPTACAGCHRSAGETN